MEKVQRGNFLKDSLCAAGITYSIVVCISEVMVYVTIMVFWPNVIKRWKIIIVLCSLHKKTFMLFK
jgi:hypothetical protein